MFYTNIILKFFAQYNHLLLQCHKLRRINQTWKEQQLRALDKAIIQVLTQFKNLN